MFSLHFSFFHCRNKSEEARSLKPSLIPTTLEEKIKETGPNYSIQPETMSNRVAPAGLAPKPNPTAESTQFKPGTIRMDRTRRFNMVTKTLNEAFSKFGNLLLAYYRNVEQHLKAT